MFNRTELIKHNNPTKIDNEELTEEENEEANLEELYRLDYLQLRNPSSGKIPADIGEREEVLVKSFANRVNLHDVSDNFQYTFQGPSNLAGRIRALCFDRNDLNSSTIMVGGVSGALFKSINGGASWTKINLPGQRHYTITAITQDPRSGFGNIWYCAGGAEIFGGSASYNAGIAGHLGDGVFKSIDNGNTWFRLINSNTGLYNQFDRGMDNIHNIIVNHLNGDIYVACTNAIFRSIDGGDNWQEVIN
ncbi:MAG: WD40/YVTN/BNR-like repeat-containing protein, partial [Nitrososphaerales archaeon]